jgi:ATP-dependent RNA helicase DDX21
VIALLTFGISLSQQNDDLIASSANKAAEEIENVDESMIALFEESAQELIDSIGAKRSLAAALACITGHTKPPRRTSLMSGVPDFVTVLFTSYNEIRAKGYVWNAINRDFSQEHAANVKQLTLTEDSMGCCFDLPIEALEALNEMIEAGGDQCQYSIPKELPKLQAPAYVGRSQGGGRGYGGGGRGGGRGFGGGRGGSSGRGGGRGFGGGRGGRRF